MVTVRANLEVGMKLTKKPSFNDNLQVIVVTAIGRYHVLAVDEKEIEHKISFKEIDDYIMTGWG